MALSSILLIPAYAMYQIFINKGNIKEVKLK